MMQDQNQIRPYEGKEGFLLVWSVKEDQPARQTCCELLARNGYRLWYPQEESNLNAKLADCSGVAAIFSPRSVCEHDFRKLVTAAVLQRKPVLAIIVDDAPLSPGMKAQLAGAPQMVYKAEAVLPPSMAAFQKAKGPENYGVQVLWRVVAQAKPMISQQLWLVSTMDEDYEQRLLASLQKSAVPNTSVQEAVVKSEAASVQPDAVESVPPATPPLDEPRMEAKPKQVFPPVAPAAPATPPAEEPKAVEKPERPPKAEPLAEHTAPAIPDFSAAPAQTPAAPHPSAQFDLPKPDAPKNAFPATEAMASPKPAAHMETVMVEMDSPAVSQGTVMIQAQAPRMILLDSGEIIDCLDGVTAVGRSAERADIVLPDPTVSSRHLSVFSMCAGSHDLRTITDCDSTNGTWFNGVRMEKGATLDVEEDFAFLRLGPKMPCLITFGEMAEKMLPGVTILVLSCNETREDRLLLTGEMPLGRGYDWPRNSLNEPHISWQHACIRLSGADASLTDTGSANGTQLNGQRLEPHASVSLHDGDRVCLGKRNFTVRVLELKRRTA